MASGIATGWTVARRNQLRALKELLVECNQHGAGAAVVTGVTGTGKTVFAERIAEYARAEGALVLTSAGSREMQDRALGVLEQLMTDHAKPDRHPGAALAAPSLSMEWAFSELINLASSGPVLLVIDDAHLSDTVSLFCVAYFLCTMTSLPIMILLTGSVELTTANGGVIPLGPRCVHIALEPFSELEVQELADAVIGKAVGAAFARACHAASGGNPRFIFALLSDSQHRLYPVGVDVGEDFASAMRQFLDRSPSVLREVVTATAVIGDDATPGLISEAIRIDVTRVMWSLRALNESGILAGSRFRHAGARELTLSWTDSWDQVRLHSRAVDHLRATGGPGRAIEHHLVAIRTLCEESLRPVLERSDLQGVDSSAVELALRCLDCAACARAGERFEEETDRNPLVVSAMAQRVPDRCGHRMPWVDAGQSRLIGQFAPHGDAVSRHGALDGPATAGAAVGNEARPLGPKLARYIRPTDIATPTRPRSDTGAEPARDAGSGPRGAIAKLSGAERRVATLAAHGHTNKAISKSLSITVSTVEQHLTRVYRKLNIQERRELRIALESDKPFVPLQRPSLGDSKN